MVIIVILHEGLGPGAAGLTRKFSADRRKNAAICRDEQTILLSLAGESVGEFGKFKWDYLSRHIGFSVGFAEKWQERINWARLSANPYISPEILRQFADKLDWLAVCRSPAPIPEDVLRANIRRLRWYALCKNKRLPAGFRRDFAEFLW